jgi:hypothetical protein
LSETESFIEEVTEEVRRDKLFALYRRYGWIAFLLVVLIVGGAAYREWRIHTEAQAAQAFGDAIMTALDGKDAATQASNIDLVATEDERASEFLTLLKAAIKVEAKDPEAALPLLDALSGEATPEPYRSLATFKAVVLRGADQDRTARMAILDRLATPGNPFRSLAMEQKALALVEFGNNQEAIDLLKAVLDEPGITQDLLERAQRLIVALGGTLSDGANSAASNG